MLSSNKILLKSFGIISDFFIHYSIATPNGLPLYPVTTQPKSIPLCSCGSKRTFECQILPTIQSFISNDTDVSLETLKDLKEWSSVLIYTCEQNCNHSIEEVVVLPPLYECLHTTNNSLNLFQPIPQNDGQILPPSSLPQSIQPTSLSLSP